MWAEESNNKPKPKASTLKLVPYGMSKALRLLGKARCQIVAKVGAETITTIYIVGDVQESLLGLRDREALGILITPGVKAARPNIEPLNKGTARKQTLDRLEQGRTGAVELTQEAL